LVIGAIIGGTFNWAAHGAKFNMKGLGYFGVGAAAGALGAGVGAGISSSIAGGSFGAGFIGSSAAMTAKSSFLYGAAIGGGVGATSGFITGFGNGLLDNRSFGKSIGQGLIYSGIGLGSGALLGGITGGIDAARNGRRFWDGATVTKTTLVEQDIPIVGQDGKRNCLPANVEAIDQSFGGNMTQEQVRATDGLGFGGSPDNNALLDGEVWTAYGNRSGHQIGGYTIVSPTTSDVYSINSVMRSGSRISITLPRVNGNSHSVVVKNISLKTITKLNGRAVSKYLLTVMDPAYGGYYRTISVNNLSGANVFSIIP
jgi:hypothetical protein